MKEEYALAYLPAAADVPGLPLARYLPPLPAGMASAWAQKTLPPGAWILDPLGSTPALPLELARSGYRVLVTCQNPILAFMLEVLASAPRREAFVTVLAELGAVRSGEERLGVQIPALYETECPQCGTRHQPSGFLWRKGEVKPHLRLLKCPNCGAEGEAALAPADEENLARISGEKLHRARALERSGAQDDEQRAIVQEALACYLPRPLSVLFTLINKAEGPSFSPEHRRLLQALLINLCDDSNTLWSPGGRTRPKALSFPAVFKENNLWLALDAAISSWCVESAPITLTHWPDLPPKSGGICLASGRLKNLLPLPSAVEPQRAAVVLPRPSQAFWTFSTLWSGWIWGREASQPLNSALERRRYDWHWHTKALHSSLKPLAGLDDDFEVFIFIPEMGPGLMQAGLLAAHTAGLNLKGLACREGELTQALYATRPSRPPAKNADLEPLCRQAIQSIITVRAEPVSYLLLHTACLAELSAQGVLPAGSEVNPADVLANYQPVIEKILADRSFLRRFESGSQDIDNSLWGLAKWQPGQTPLADQIEVEIVRYLQAHPQFRKAELEAALFNQLTGLLTPPADIEQAILESYTEPDPDQPGVLQLRAQDSAAARREDLADARRRLLALAEQMGLSAKDGTPLIWQDSSGKALYSFYLLASGLLARHVDSAQVEGEGVLVFPGSRSGLIEFKLRRDPRLRAALSGWHLLKYRHLRLLAERVEMNLSLWQSMLDSDPPGWEGVRQMSMFNDPPK